MRKYSVFEVGKNASYFDDGKNHSLLERIAQKSYLPTNSLLLDLVRQTKGKFKVSLSITGVLLDQLEKDFPDVLKSFKDLVSSGCCELIGETYYHTLASLYSEEEFQEQVKLQEENFKKNFNVKPKFFRNTELVYNNHIATLVEKLGYEGILAEGCERILGWRSPNYLYRAKGGNLKLLLRNYRLSDDISFRFSNRDWPEWPLTSEKFSGWINALNYPHPKQIVNLFMDYETFGEHQWKETGIFDFLRAFCFEALKNGDNYFTTPSELIKLYNPAADLNVPDLVSWADTERDLSAWLGNSMQQSSLEKIYSLENEIRKCGDEEILKDWRILQTSDHFYYMCTKWFADGDVHKYFNPYESPYESFITFMNIFNDFKLRLEALKGPAKGLKVAKI